MSGPEHEHQDQAPGLDWFRVLDTLVWVSVAIIVCFAAEWLIGYLVRERIAAGADRWRAKATTGGPDTP